MIRNRNNIFFLLPLIFFLGLFPFAATFVQNYPDEWHYINAALIMQQTGDYWTPYDLTGELIRFKKPILPYWAVVSGFHLFGLHVFSLRFFFLLAGSLTVALVGWMTRSIFPMIILMTEIPFFLASVRAIPDILLTLFLTMSACGVLRLLNRTPDRFGLNWWLFYWGAAFAVESKGFLALLFLGYAWIFLWVSRRDLFRQNRLSHVLSALTALVIAGSWYVAMFLKHGDAFIHAFLNDQILARIHHSFWLPLIHIPLAALGCVLTLLPWALICFKRKKTTLRSLSESFIVIWAGIVVVVIGLGENVTTRYLLPLAPLLAIVAAERISALEDAVFIRRLSRFGILLFLFYVSFFIPLSKVALPDPSEKIVSALDKINTPPAYIDFIGYNRLAANIRLLSQGRYSIHYLATRAQKLQQPIHFPVLISEHDARLLHLPSEGQKKIVLSESLEDMTVSDFISGIFTGNLKQKIQNHQKEYWLIYRDPLSLSRIKSQK